ncbi:MAG: thiamine-binding protein [Lentisphaeria bacterium]|nr:thiamine-binding protein [Lentisphaeria bacterium]
MTVQAEMSLYPLRTTHLGKGIDRFLGALGQAGMTVTMGSMSSTLEGGADEVFAALARAYKAVATDTQVVLLLKISNACPPCSSRERESPHDA